MRSPLLAFALVSLAAFGCSSSTTPSNSSGACTSSPAAGYPACPYGVTEGEVVENASFVGHKSGIGSPRETFDLASYRASGKKLLVLNVAAFWCSPCKEEAKEFQSTIVPKYDAKGVAFLSVVLENAGKSPASDDDIDVWIKTFGLTFPVARDPDFFVTEFFDKNAMPLNMIIDLETMKIVSKVVGADLAKVQADLDAALGG